MWNDRCFQGVVWFVVEIVLRKKRSYRGAATSCVSGGLEDEAGTRIAQRPNRRFHATEMVLNEEIPLMGNTTNNGDVHRAGRNCLACLIERDVELTATGIRDEIWSL